MIRPVLARFMGGVAFAALMALALGCGDAPTTSSDGRLGSGRRKRKPPTSEEVPTPEGDIAPLVYHDEDFMESERNRDPFRTYLLDSEAIKAPEVSQRRVVMPNTPIEAMRLIAIVTGTDRPRAMLTDPAAVGYVVERGMYIGRPQVLQTSANVPITMNWRVDRIRDNEVVLTRPDPKDPSRPALVRVMPLHEELALR